MHSVFFFGANKSVFSPFGKIDNADLEMTRCDFEPDGNAEMLFNKADVYYDGIFDIQGRIPQTDYDI